MAALGNILNFAGELTGSERLGQLGRSINDPFGEADLRKKELEMRQQERAAQIAEMNRQRQMQQAQQRAFGNLAPQLSERFNIPLESVTSLIQSGVTPQTFGQLGNLMQRPQEPLVEVYDQATGQMIRVPQSQAVGRPSKAPERPDLPPEAELFEWEESLRNDNPAAYERYKAAKGQETDFKEGELNAANFANRMVGSIDLLEGLEQTEGFNPISAGATAASLFGRTAERLASSPELQKYKNAAQDWIRAKLRKESGAVIGDEEMQTEYETYFPVFGDTPEVIQQKQALRERATKGMIQSSQGAFERLYGQKVDGQNNNQPLTAQEQAELERLRKKYGR